MQCGNRKLRVIFFSLIVIKGRARWQLTTTYCVLRTLRWSVVDITSDQFKARSLSLMLKSRILSSSDKLDGRNLDQDFGSKRVLENRLYDMRRSYELTMKVLSLLCMTRCARIKREAFNIEVISGSSRVYILEFCLNTSGELSSCFKIVRCITSTIYSNTCRSRYIGER